jgi:radical SAM protein with 4Fe4S-binding SPASM domain
MEAAIITTYQCNNKCQMCHIWQNPSEPEQEITPDLLNKLPKLDFANITGGEPFLREDIADIVKIIKQKARRVVISTNGFFTDKIIDLATINKDIGIRVSIEGLPMANDELRGQKNSFDHGLKTLLALQRIGLKDIGFGITVSDKNASDMLDLYQLAKAMNMEFATAVVHNSYYFHKMDNAILDKDQVISCFNQLINELLRTSCIKNWFRAYFNHGLINYVKGNPRLLPCGAGTDMFFLDPYGEIRPCNGMASDTLDNSMGNLKEKSFDEIWQSAKADKIREAVHSCSNKCWMIGTASPAMKKDLIKVVPWVVKNKLKNILGKSFLET